MKTIQDIISNVNKTRDELLKEATDSFLAELEAKMVANLLATDLKSKTQQVQSLDYLDVTDWYNRVQANEAVAALVFSQLKVGGFGIQKREIILAASAPTPMVVGVRKYNNDPVVNNIELDPTVITYHIISLQNRQF